jgi:MinD superfamily P-loop ATPase
VVNRLGSGDNRVHAFCREQRIPIILEIPDDRRIAEAYSKGRLVVEALPEYRGHFERLLKRAAELCTVTKEAYHADV